MKIESIFWKNKRVFITGHTGFKGAWLTALLNELGAKTGGYSLPPPSDLPSLYSEGVRPTDLDVLADIRDAAKLEQTLTAFKPDVVFHMAAQALVLLSYEDPIGTFNTNVMGTVHVLMASLKCPNLRVVVNVTSDKCYENREWHWPYRESDPMGGYDPYSASKGCAELAASSLRRSFFADKNIALPSVRAGNVIGGGDWALHRIVPDLMQGFAKRQTVVIRNPSAIRPWQHVLEPLRAYVQIAQAAWERPAQTSQGWNIGPDTNAAQPVSVIAAKTQELWGAEAKYEVVEPAQKKHEAKFLKLDTSLIRSELGWRPLLDLDLSLKWTVDWYKRFYAGESAKALCAEQLRECLALDAALNVT